MTIDTSLKQKKQTYIQRLIMQELCLLHWTSFSQNVLVQEFSGQRSYSFIAIYVRSIYLTQRTSQTTTSAFGHKRL